MRYSLREDLSFCRIQDHLIFLDIRRDLYFRVSHAMEQSLLSYMESGVHHEVDVSALVAHNILVETSDVTPSMLMATIKGPSSSAMEQSKPLGKLQLRESLEVFTDVYMARRCLRTYKLKEVLGMTASYRRVKIAQRPATVSPEHLQKLIVDAAAAFRRTRLYVPVETCCLLDSIAMVGFLAKRGTYASIVFGVIGDPFSAHCWVQAEDVVLNDTVGNANAHTPILVL